MSTTKKITVCTMDRLLRIFIGAVILMLAFAVPLTANWFTGLTLASTYPLLTGVAAWDPFYAAFEFVRERFIDYHIFHR